MQDLKTDATDPSLLSPIALAFIGDGVFELLVRERLVQNGTLPANKLHQMTVKRVSAAAQAQCYNVLEAELNEKERDILKRGRNANTARVPKSCTCADYSKATAIEALFGYLYLSSQLSRINELFAIMDTVFDEQEDANAKT